jgi:hypothetical protein
VSPAWSACEWCGRPARQGPRGGFRPRCDRCERERQAEKGQAPPARGRWYEQNREHVLRMAKAKRIRAGKQPAVRLCRRCGDPATSSRHHLCDKCRDEPRVGSGRSWSSAVRRHQLSRQARGYGATHDRRRKSWERKVAAGGVVCGYCGRPINPGDPWDLSHPGDDKSAVPVPWHASCNRRYAVTVTKRRRNRERAAR